jgi:hypothetical protein
MQQKVASGQHGALRGCPTLVGKLRPDSLAILRLFFCSLHGDIKGIDGSSLLVPTSDDELRYFLVHLISAKKIAEPQKAPSLENAAAEEATIADEKSTSCIQEKVDWKGQQFGNALMSQLNKTRNLTSTLIQATNKDFC